MLSVRGPHFSPLTNSLITLSIARPTVEQYVHTTQLLLELAHLEVEHPGLVNENSSNCSMPPTGGESLSLMRFILCNAQSVPMHSIDNTYSFRRCRTLLQQTAFPVSKMYLPSPTKTSTVAISLRYELRTLVAFSTLRWATDLKSSDDETVQASAIRSIPLTLRARCRTSFSKFLVKSKFRTSIP